MRLADDSVPKMNAEEDETDGVDGLCFCTAHTAIGEILPRCAGKVLLVSDGVALPAVAPFGGNVRTITVVAEEDALPFFSMPDGVGAVIAAGGERTLVAARFFAEVRRIPCYLFPVSCDLRGAFERCGSVRVGENVTRMPLAEAEVFCDRALLGGSHAEGYGALLLARLARIEARALQGILNSAMKSAGPQPDGLPVSLAAVIAANERLRRLEAAGAHRGEGVTLCGLYREAGDRFPFWRAYRALTALYTAFFERGVPRRYFVPDYGARAVAAGVERWTVSVPSRAEYAQRALAFERIRGEISAELANERALLPEFRRVLENLAGERMPAGELTKIGFLPERCPEGLCAVIRDFGLLEF